MTAGDVAAAGVARVTGAAGGVGAAMVAADDVLTAGSSGQMRRLYRIFVFEINLYFFDYYTEPQQSAVRELEWK